MVFFKLLNNLFTEVKMAIDSNVSHMIYCIFSPILSTVFAVFNIITIVIFVRKFRLSSLLIVLMTNICVCDIIVCLVSNSFYVVNLAHPTYTWATGPLACKLFKTITIMLNLSQIFSLVIICLDRMRRYIQVFRKQWSKLDGIIFLTIIWFLSAAISAPRLVLFDEMIIKSIVPGTNSTPVVNYACKPVGVKSMWYAFMIITQFIIGFAIPCVCIMTSVVACQIYSWRYISLLRGSSSAHSATSMMNKQLATTFNLTGVVFLVIWAPFFSLALIDLYRDLSGNKDLVHMNFSLRCTLLVIGSGKPLIYLMSLTKFRTAVITLFCKKPIE